MGLEHRVSRLEGRHGDSWWRDDLFSHISDSELWSMYKRVRITVSQEERDMLDRLFGAYFGAAQPDGE
jgi:hypothetical protein